MSRLRDRKILIPYVALLLLVTVSICNAEFVTNSADVAEVYSNASMRESHDPIIIQGNSDFLAQKAANNWTGTGEPHAPITISNYRIEFSDEGITIRNVNLHFMIINCETGDYGSQYWFSTGIKIINCTNGAIEESVAHMKETGILIDSSSHISLHYNTVHDCATGVTVSDSQFIQLDNNNFGWNDWVGVNLTLTDHCTVNENSIISVPHYGIQCWFDKSTSIINNEITSDYLDDEHDEFANVGIFNYGSWNLAMWNNHIHECAIGLEMLMVNGSWVWESVVGNCTEYCIYLGDETFNVTIVDNFIGPSIVSNAYDSGTSNHWDELYGEIGNYWSDYSGTGYYYISGPVGSIDHFPNGFHAGNFTVPTIHNTSPTDPTSTSPTTNPEGGEFQPVFLAISIGSSLVILIVIVLMIRSGRSP